MSNLHDNATIAPVHFRVSDGPRPTHAALLVVAHSCPHEQRCLKILLGSTYSTMNFKKPDARLRVRIREDLKTKTTPTP
jgi:hypothetical protein